VKSVIEEGDCLECVLEKLVVIYLVLL